MNYFFGVNNDLFKSKLQIPLFQNRLLKKNNLKLYKSYPKENEWIIEEVSNSKKINDYFYILKDTDISNNQVYFLEFSNKVSNTTYDKIWKTNIFTNTSPAYRANLEIYIKNGGFSSYQSEYPYSMVLKKGSILSSINSLANIDADNNYILFKNIYELPIFDKFKAYLVNYKTKKVECEYILKTNFTNLINLKKEYIKPEIFFITKDFLGIPMYVSVKNKMVSFEHTHPPHEYILSNNKFIKISELKKEMYEIIN